MGIWIKSFCDLNNFSVVGMFLLLGICFSPVSTFGECIKGDCANGHGTMTYPDGSKYEGQWKDDRRNGQGTMIFPDGGTLAGQWADDHFNGQGTMIYSYGTYKGQWKGGVKNGQGIMTYPDGSKYVGQWKNDRRCGQGTYTYFDGGKYVGQWKDGRKNGQGVYFYPDGGKYVGRFKDGDAYGKGVMTFPDGNYYEGKLENGTFIQDQMSEGEGATSESDTYPYTIQVGSCRNRENSNNLTMKLRKNGLPAFVSPALIPGRGDFYRIFIGYYSTFEETRRAASQLKDQKDLNPIESKMPYAIQVGTFDSDQELINMEATLRSKDFLAYSIPGTNKTRLLVGAFRTEQEAARFNKRLQIEGVKAKVVTR